MYVPTGREIMWLFVVTAGLQLVLWSDFALCVSVSVTLDMCDTVKTVSTHKHCDPLQSTEFFFEKEKVKVFEKKESSETTQNSKNVHGVKRS